MFLLALKDKIFGALMGWRLGNKFLLRCMKNPATGLQNRVFLESKLEALEVAGERRSQIGANGCVVVSFDIDNFKMANDSLVHAAGDLVLGIFSELLIKLFRLTDEKCHWGGDEFIVVCWGASKQDVLPRAYTVQQLFPIVLTGDAFCHAVEEELEGAFSVGRIKEALRPVSVSFGLACTNSVSLSSLAVALRKADQMMYFDKASRN